MMNGKDEVEGKIEVQVNSFHFHSSNLNLCIPWKQIDKIEKDNKVFTDFIIVTTQKGDIKFK